MTTSEVPELSVDEANALVPTLHRLVSRQMRLQAEVAEELEALHKRLGRLPRDITPHVDDPGDVIDRKEKIAELIQSVEDGWAEVSALGCVVKDPRVGLVDFYGRVDGELVCLCWKFGEEAILHYHGLDEGFAGRKPLPAAAPLHRLFN